MRTITTIGLDLAKKVFQVDGVDVAGKVVVARKLRRKEVFVLRQAAAVPGRYGAERQRALLGT